MHEVKYDGYRMQLRVEKGKARLRTRKGLDWTDRFAEIAKDAAKLPDCMLDGEICALDAEGRSDFAGLQNALSSGRTSALVYFLFDCLFADGCDLRPLPLLARKERLKTVISAKASRSPRLRFSDHFSSSGQTFLDAACRMDLEGVVSKRVDAPYASGRNDAWTKTKCRGGQEVVIGGWRGNDSTLRSLLVGTYDGDTLVYRGKVGTGYPGRVAADVLARLKPLKQSRAAFANPPRGGDISWVAPRLVGEIEYETVTTDGLFRQSAFKGLRLDKQARNVTIERAKPVEAAEEDAAMAAKRKTKPGKVRPTGNSNRPSVDGIAISHPDKTLWPQTKKTDPVSKLELAEYYAAAAERMLAHIADRPISVVRAPDGIEGETFFQRHKLIGTAAPMLAIKVKGEAEPYLGLDNAKSLVALAQAGVLEIHPWGSKKGDPDSPERVILDLDPAPDVPFARVIEGAKELRQRLKALGFEPFVKTTGGKGLHVVIAVKGSPKNGIGWADAKAFAKAIAVEMAADSPERYTTTIAKKARTGRIFIDYLRNDRTSTGVAPWSPRARPAAPIAVPLAWSQLKSGLDPQAFRIDTAAPLLRRADAWDDLARTARPIAGALNRLAA